MSIPGTSFAQNPLDSQYHHFIPQFIIRKFSNLEELRKKIPAKRAKQRSEVSIYNLEKENFGSSLTSRTFGVQDMYRDIDKDSIDKLEIEKKLDRLEDTAAKILARVETAFRDGQTSFTLERKDKDELRRFLFIMLYRNRTLEGRYEKSKENFNAVDRSLMLKYMEEKGFEVPKAVWLANIHAFLDVQLGYDTERWERELGEKAYPPDARWFAHHLQNTFLSFCCTPVDSPDEFLLTQNAYSVYEGPNSERLWMDWHVFATISPHMAIVLRQNLLQKMPGTPAGLEAMRQTLLQGVLSQFPDPSAAKSTMMDLPLEKPQVAYKGAESGITSHQVFLSNKDLFTFKFIRLCSDHTQLINSIFLEEALGTVGIVFRTSEGFKRALEAYFVLDPIGFKHVASNSRLSKRNPVGLAEGLEKNDWILANRERYLKLLEMAAAQLDSSIKPRYIDRNPSS